MRLGFIADQVHQASCLSLSCVASKEVGGAMGPAELVTELTIMFLLDELDTPEFCTLCDVVGDTACYHSRTRAAHPDRNLKQRTIVNQHSSRR